MRHLHALIAARAHTLKAHEEICFWQDSVLLLGRVENDEESYRRVMTDVIALKMAIDGIHPCHAVCVKGKSFPAPRFRRHRSGPRAIYVSASSLAFSNSFDIEHRLREHSADWYIDSRITNMCSFRAADLTADVKLLPGNIARKVRIYHGSPEKRDTRRRGPRE
jgi:hypothetical protein